VKVNKASKKIQESRLRWYGYLKRRNGEAHIGREVMEKKVEGYLKERPRTRWKGFINGDMKEKNLDEDMAIDREQWRRLIHNCNPESLGIS
jgi:hypothetical protein